jgi:hypothetical protein
MSEQHTNERGFLMRVSELELARDMSKNRLFYINHGGLSMVQAAQAWLAVQPHYGIIPPESVAAWEKFATELNRYKGDILLPTEV